MSWDNGYISKVVEIEPMGAVRLTQRSLWTPRAQKYATYKEHIRLAVGSTYTLPEELFIEFVIAMPKSWSQKKKLAMDGQPHKQKPDCDNLIKSWCDAFGVDDSHVHTIHAHKRWGTSGSIRVRI